MILPIGHEDSEVRRWPWLTYGFIVLCLIALFGTDPYGDGGPTSASDAAFEDAVTYWRGHAYLDAPPDILTQVGYDVMPNQRTQYIALVRDRDRDTAPAIDSEERHAEQARLDELVARANGELGSDEVVGTTTYHRWGIIPAAPSLYGWFTYMLIHAGFFHWLGNALLLFVMAPAIEDRFGRPMFAALFVSAGVFAALTHAVFTSDPTLPLVGASGALAGVLGAFAVRFTTTQIRFLYWFRGERGTFDSPAWFMLPLWFANEVLQAVVVSASGSGDGVGYFAHIGGFLFGAGAAYGIGHFQIEERFVHAKIEALVTVNDANPVVEEALTLRQDERDEDAFELLQGEVAANPEDPDAALAFWDVCVTLQRPERAARAFGGLIRNTSVSDRSLATRYWIELTNLVPGALIDPATLMRIVPELREMEQSELALTAMRHACDPGNTGLSAGIALRVLDETRSEDPPTALRAARAALGFEDMHEAKRAKLQAVVDELSAAGVEELSSAVGAAQSSPPDPDGTCEIPLDVDDAEPGDEFLANRNSTSLEAELRAARENPQAELANALDTAVVVPPPVPVTPQAAGASAGPPPVPVAVPVPPAEAPPPIPAPALPQPSESSADVSEEALVAELIDGDDDFADIDDIAALEELDELEGLAELAEREGLGEAGPVEDDLHGFDSGARFPDLKWMDVTPRELDATRLSLATADGRNASIALDQIQAVAVAAVSGIKERPVVVIDLLMNWNSTDEEPLRSLRMRSDGFDPRPLAPDAEDGPSALRSFIGQLIALSGATALPSHAAASGSPFAVIDSPAAYERDVLSVERGG